MTLQELVEKHFGTDPPVINRPIPHDNESHMRRWWDMRIHFDTNMEQVQIPALAGLCQLQAFLTDLLQSDKKYVAYMPMQRMDFYRCTRLIIAHRQPLWEGSTKTQITFKDWVEGRIQAQA